MGDGLRSKWSCEASTDAEETPAASKRHLVMTLNGRAVRRVELTGERAGDHRTLR